MIVLHNILDLDGLDFLVGFEFHKELDGQLVFDGAWDIIDIVNGDGESITDEVPNADQKVHRWLSAGGEDTIYEYAQRVL